LETPHDVKEKSREERAVSDGGTRFRGPARTRRGPLAVVLAVGMLAGAGCTERESEEAKVESVLTTFLADAADGKGDEACKALTGNAVRYVATVGALARDEASCPDAVETLSGLFAADEKEALKSADVRRVSVQDDRATIAREDIALEYQGESRLFPRAPGAQVVLVKTDDGWKIDSLG
jgi:hypothetical protein